MSVAWAIILVGTTVRVATLVRQWPLRHDEAALALNIIERSWGGLLQPLDYDQGAPVGFLMTEKLAITVLGPSEGALRLAPLAAGLACLVFGLALVRRTLGPAPGLMAMTMLAIGKPFLFFSTDAKQYTLDMAAATLLTWLSLRLYQDGLRGRDLALWTTAGVISMWFSHPSVFIFAGSALVLLILCFRARRRFVGVATGVACVAASFLAHYLLFARTLQAEGFLRDFWYGYMSGAPPHSLGAFRWVSDAFMGACAIPFGLPARWLAAPLVLAGVWALWHGDRMLRKVAKRLNCAGLSRP